MTYRALDLYKISSRKGKLKSYHAEVKNGGKIQAFVTDDRNLKKIALKDSLAGKQSKTSETGNTKITEAILKNNYIVFLLDSNNRVIVAKAGKTKDILEEFNKEISKSKYSEFLELDKANTVLELMENIEEEDKITVSELKGNARESKKYLSSINPLDTKRVIQEEDLISTAVRTINLELDHPLETSKVLSILRILDHLKIPMAHNTRMKAIDKLNSIKASPVAA